MVTPAQVTYGQQFYPTIQDCCWVPRGKFTTLGLDHKSVDLLPPVPVTAASVAVPAMQQVAFFAAASEAFSAANINCSIQESLIRFKPAMEKAKAASLPVRGYVSCVLGCPYEGRVAPGAVIEVSGGGLSGQLVYGCCHVKNRFDLGCLVPPYAELLQLVRDGYRGLRYLWSSQRRTATLHENFQLAELPRTTLWHHNYVAGVTSALWRPLNS